MTHPEPSHHSHTTSRWTEEAAAATGLADEDRLYLTRTGLLASVPPNITTTAPAPGAAPSRIGAYVVLGHDHETPFCVDPTQAGRVITLIHGELACFTNSNVRCFARFLDEYLRYRTRIALLDERLDRGEIDALIAEVEAAMGRLDPPALANPSTYWSQAIEEMRLGFL